MREVFIWLLCRAPCSPANPCVRQDSCQDKFRLAASRAVGAATQAKAAEKHRKWREMGDGAGKRFVALVSDTFGYLSPECYAFAHELGDIVAQNGGHKASYMRALFTELSCALSKGLGRQYERVEVNVVRASGRNFKLGHECVISGSAED